jgi:hypothetical protein
MDETRAAVRPSAFHLLSLLAHVHLRYEILATGLLLVGRSRGACSCAVVCAATACMRGSYVG